MSNTVKVGVFGAAALVLLAVLIFKIEDLNWFGSGGQRVEAMFDDVAGLDDKAAVRVAGVRVGRVDGIRLADQRAIVGLLLETPLELREGAVATISSLGLLGDKFIELRMGSPDAPLLPPGTLIPGSTPLGWDDAMSQLSGLGTTIQDTLTSLDPQQSGETVRRLLDNLEATSATVRELVAANQQQLTGTVANFEAFSATLASELPKLTAQVERVLTQFEGVVADNRESLRESLEHVAEISSSMRTSIDNLNQISGKIASGEGTIGKFVNSDEAHDQLTATLSAVQDGISSLTDTLGRVQRMKLGLDFEGYVFTETDDARTAFSLTFDPESSHRFYRIGGVDDARGRMRSRTDIVTVTNDAGETSTTTTTTRTREDKITLSAQFGFRFGDAELRAGLFESTGGAALDYGLFDKRVWVSLEAFDFNRDETTDPHLRLKGEWRLNPNLYLVGGYDDFLLSDRESLFLGAGVRWTDDDFKYLLGSLPTGR